MVDGESWRERRSVWIWHCWYYCSFHSHCSSHICVVTSAYLLVAYCSPSRFERLKEKERYSSDSIGRDASHPSQASITNCFLNWTRSLVPRPFSLLVRFSVFSLLFNFSHKDLIHFNYTLCYSFFLLHSLATINLSIISVFSQRLTFAIKFSVSKWHLLRCIWLSLFWLYCRHSVHHCVLHWSVCLCWQVLSSDLKCNCNFNSHRICPIVQQTPLTASIFSLLSTTIISHTSKKVWPSSDYDKAVLTNFYGFTKSVRW